MNLYQVFVIDAMVPLDVGLEIRYWEHEDIYELIFAETPGKAKSWFMSEYHEIGAFEFTDIRCRLLWKNIDRESGLVNWDDPVFEDPEYLAQLKKES